MTKLIKARLMSGVMIAVALLAGCAQTPVASAPPAGPSYHFAYPPVDLHFTATTVDGQQFSGTTLLGKPALVWFWAPWCPICQSQIDGVKAIVQKYRGRVTVVGIGGLDKARAIRRGAEVLPGVTNLMDVDGDVWQRFRITSQAEFVVLDPAGKVIAIDDNLEAHVRSDLQQLAG